MSAIAVLTETSPRRDTSSDPVVPTSGPLGAHVRGAHVRGAHV